MRGCSLGRFAAAILRTTRLGGRVGRAETEGLREDLTADDCRTRLGPFLLRGALALADVFLAIAILIE